MLKISGPGWAEISIEGKVVFEGSYLTDVPCDFLKALHDYFSYNSNDIYNTRGSSSVYVDCEGGVANFVFSDMFTIFATNYIQQINEKITYFQRRNINDDIYGVLAKPQQH